MKSETQLYWVSGISKQELIDLGVTPESICTNIAGDESYDLTQCDMSEKQAHELIPKDTQYCYTYKDGIFHHCPFWDLVRQFPRQGNGYCHFMKKGDDAQGGLLWDSIKECGLFDHDFSDYE